MQREMMQPDTCIQPVGERFGSRSIASPQAHHLRAVYRDLSLNAVRPVFLWKINRRHAPVAQRVTVVCQAIYPDIRLHLHIRSLLHIMRFGVNQTGYIGHIRNHPPELSDAYPMKLQRQVLPAQRIGRRIKSQSRIPAIRQTQIGIYASVIVQENVIAGIRLKLTVYQRRLIRRHMHADSFGMHTGLQSQFDAFFKLVVQIADVRTGTRRINASPQADAECLLTLACQSFHPAMEKEARGILTGIEEDGIQPQAICAQAIQAHIGIQAFIGRSRHGYPKPVVPEMTRSQKVRYRIVRT